jgi:hypothetical protein
MKGRIWIIPHTHYAVAVFKTQAEYLETGLLHILLPTSIRSSPVMLERR